MSDRNEVKSPLIQVLLAALFGPLGLFYSSVPAAVVLSLCTLVLAKDTGGEGVWLAWPLAIAIGLYTVRHWNRRAAARAGSSPSQPRSMRA